MLCGGEVWEKDLEVGELPFPIDIRRHYRSSAVYRLNDTFPSLYL